MPSVKNFKVYSYTFDANISYNFSLLWYSLTKLSVCAVKTKYIVIPIARIINNSGRAAINEVINGLDASR